MSTESASKGIPTAKKIDHFAITVPDFDEAKEFLIECIGCELLYEGKPPVDADQMDLKVFYGENLNVHPDSEMVFAKLRYDEATNIEILEYDDPTQRTEHPKNSDNGASHIAFFVEDMEAAVDHVSSYPGVEIQDRPRTVESGPLEGLSLVYFTAPWGYQMELVSYGDDVAEIYA